MALLGFYDRTTARLRAAGEYLWPLALRLILFWEFWESGITKFRGRNWFADIPYSDWQKGFPWPFNQTSSELNWLLATWGELVLSVMLLLGLFTRFTAVSLVVITAVATAAVHWPAEWSGLGELWSGYLITAKGGGNFKLPLLFIIMLLPLVFHGGGRISLDRALLILTSRGDRASDTLGDMGSVALALLVLALSVVFMEPAWGITLLAAAGLALVLLLVRNRR